MANEEIKRRDDGFYEVRWYGRSRVLMSRNYCRDRGSVQEYINKVYDRISKDGARGCKIIGSDPSYFAAFEIDQSGIEIRMVNEARWPYNRVEDRFDQLHLLYSVPFVSMLDEVGLREFAKQEKERNSHG